MLVIDAYNVMHTTGVLPPDIAGLDIDGLIRLLGQGRYAGHRIMIVCDGLPSGFNKHSARHDCASVPTTASDAFTLSRGKGMQILYSGNAEADAIIEDVVAKAHRTQKPLVVSSDRRIQTAAKKRRFAVISSERFLHQLADDHAAAGRARTVGPSPRELVPLEANLVALWAKALGFDVVRERVEVRQGGVPREVGLMVEPPPRATPLFIGGDRIAWKETTRIADAAGLQTSAKDAAAVGAGAAESEAARRIDVLMDAQITAILRRAKQAQTAVVRARPELPMAVSVLTNAAGSAAMAGSKVGRGSKWAKHTSAADTHAITRAEPERNPTAHSSSVPAQIDQQLNALLEHSSDGLSPADLDMSKWLSLPNAMAEYARQPEQTPMASGKQGSRLVRSGIGRISPRHGKK